MKTGARLAVGPATLVLLLAAPVVLGQATTLQYKVAPGQRRLYEWMVRVDHTVRSDKGTVRTVREIPARRDDLVVETKAQPPSMRIVTLETPADSRLVALEENGQDRLTATPEAERLTPVQPVLSAYWRSASGRMTEARPAPRVPMQAISQLQEEMRLLPEKAVAPGQTWTRQVDLGIAKAAITTRFVGPGTQGGVPAAVIDCSATVTFAGEMAKRIQIEKATCRIAFAADGSGRLAQSGSLTIREKTDTAEQHVIRSWHERLIGTGTLPDEALTKTKNDLDEIEKAMAHVGKGELDAAMQLLDAFIKANSGNPWTPALRDLHAELSERRLLTQAVPAPRLRLLLRDLQNARDQAGTGGGGRDDLVRIDATLRRITTINAKTLLMDAADTDPIVRDLAAFGLAFVEDPQARDRLVAMTNDASGQVRGTALIGMAIQGRAIEHRAMKALLTDSNTRTRGAAALLAARTIKNDDPQAAELVALMIENLAVKGVWVRVNTVTSIAALSPRGSVAAARALINACKAEQEAKLKPVYLGGLKRITGLDAADLAPFEVWLTKQPAPKTDPAKPIPQG